MAHSVQVVCRPGATAGFALAGLAPFEAGTTDDGVMRVRALLDRSDVGVVLLEDTLYDALPAELVRQMSRRPLPMVVPFPGPAWGRRRDAAEAYIVDLLRQVIGYRVRLR